MPTTEEDPAKQYWKTLKENAAKKGISPLDLLSSLIIKPEETVTSYLPGQDIETIKNNPPDLIIETVKEKQPDLNIKLVKPANGQPPKKPLTYNKIRNAIADRVSTYAIRQYYNKRIKKARNIKKETSDKLRKIEKTYDWVYKWSKILFHIGLAIVIVDVIVSACVLYIFYGAFNQLLNSIVPAFALFAILTSSPAIFTSLPAISTSIPWQQIITASGVIGAIGLGSIITTFIKGSFQEVSNSSIDSAQVNLILRIYSKQIQNSTTALRKNLYEYKNKQIKIKNKEKATKEVLETINNHDDEETTILKELLNRLQNYLQSPIKTEETGNEESNNKKNKLKSRKISSS